MKRLKSGKNWRVGWDDQADPFKALLGGEDWACELTQAEFSDFFRLLTDLSYTMDAMALELMEEEAIAIDKETDLLWIQINGFPQAYDLSFILLTGRRAEGHWNKDSSPALIQAIQTIQLF